MQSVVFVRSGANMGRPGKEYWRFKVIPPVPKRDKTKNWMIRIHPPRRLVLAGAQQRYLRHSNTLDRDAAQREGERLLLQFQALANDVVAPQALPPDAL